MPDPLVFGPGRPGCHCGHPWCRYCDPEAAEAAAAMRHAEAAAIARAYHAHGDQLGALEAEAARDSAPLTAAGWLRALLRMGLGPWSDDDPRGAAGQPGARPPRRPRPP